MKMKSIRSAAARSIEPLESRRLFAGGTPDVSFSGDGTATVDSFGVGATAVTSRVDSQGRTVTVGKSSDGKWAIARLTIDGSLDTTFGPSLDGKLQISFGGYIGATDLAFQKDGKIVVVGASSGHDEFGIARLNTNGTLDTTFDGDGKKTVGWSTLDGATAYAVVIQSDGKIVVAGDGEFSSILNGINYDFAVARLNTNGSMDTSFDGDGKRSVGLGDYEHCLGVGIDTSGRIVVAGDSSSSNAHPTKSGIAAVRFNSSGALDARFDADGKARYFLDKPVIASGMVMQGDKVVITGTYGGNDLIMARIGVDGKLDNTFGGGGIGWKVTNLGGTEVSLGAMKAFNGDILVSASSSSKTVFAKYTPDGALDPAFGVGGVARPSIPFNTSSGVTGAGKITPFGDRIIMAGGDGTFRTSRFLDVNSNVVSVGTFNSVATETGSSQRAFIVTRTNRLPYATNVYFDLGGTAKAPLFNLPRRGTGEDYGIMDAAVPGVTGLKHYYATIPANQTFATVTLSILDDALVEPTETINVRLVPDSAYGIGIPSTSFIIQDNDGVTQTKTLRATADTFVKGGTSANANFGTSSELQVKNNSTSQGDARQSFLKFDLSSAASIGSAKLRLYGYLNNANKTNVVTEVHSSGVTSWSEAGTTYNNKPAIRDEVLGQITVANTTAKWYEVDLTAYLRAEKLAGRNTVTLVLTNPVSSDPYAAFSSDEAASNRPELVITT